MNTNMRLPRGRHVDGGVCNENIKNVLFMVESDGICQIRIKLKLEPSGSKYFLFGLGSRCESGIQQWHPCIFSDG